jgi:hypothetical protein
MESSFQEFPKIARLNREMVITEKIDGTNAHVIISEPCCGAETALYDSGRVGCQVCAPWIAEVGGLRIAAGSRTRYITPDNDNHGFARWVKENAASLRDLGIGRHYGEWWGSGIQRGYGLPKGEKRFSLFNVSRWTSETVPWCCHVVPTLYRGNFDTEQINYYLGYLRNGGSYAAPGFMRPEGIVVYHTAANQLFKITLEKDQLPKSLAT